MKKHLKRLAVTVTVLFAFLGAGFTVAFASGYVNWGGTDDYRQLIVNLDLFRTEGIEVIKDRDAVIEEKDKAIVEKDKAIEDKDGKITELEESITTGENELAKIKTDVAAIVTNANSANGKGNKFDALQTDVNNLAEYLGVNGRIESTNGDKDYTGKSDQLKQAEEDMEKARLKSDALLNELRSIPEVKPESTDGNEQ